MKKGFFLTFMALVFAGKLMAAELSSINFSQTGEVSRLEMQFDSADVLANKFHIPEDKQIILDLKDVSSTDRVMRAFDTSEFSGSIVFVSAYKSPKSPKDIRIAIQLRDNVRSVLRKRPKKLVLEIENRFGVFTQNQLNQSSQAEDEIAKGQDSRTKLLVPKSDSLEDILENLTMSGRKKYIGKKISFNVRDMKVEDILKLIADASGFNIIITKEIKSLPTLTLNLNNVPWDQALDTILGLNKLVAKKNGEILMITTLKQETKDREMEAKAKDLLKKEEPLVTKVFGISFAKTAEMRTIIKDYLTRGRGKISEDKRLNALIIKDTPETIERIRKIIESLDTQTPQILIQSKIVEVNEEFRQEIGLKNGVEVAYDAFAQPSNDGNAVFAFNTAPTTGGDNPRTLFGLSVSNFLRLTTLDFQLNLMESESKGKIIASPKVITQNKKPATISTSDTTSFTVQTIGANGTTTSSFQPVNATLTLSVTPQVTNEGSISMDINLSKSAFGATPQAGAPPNQTTRSINTSVLVDNGSTIVLGGIYTFRKNISHAGLPFLKDVPLIGWIFRTAYNPETSKSEMVIFLTPRIINQEEAGLSDTGS